jgi:hypothetical protein
MAIKLVPDVAVPAGVFVADWATSAYDEKATGMKLNRPVGIGLAILGYAGAMLNWGGDAVKNIGIASFDWAANSVVSYIKERGGTTAGATSRMERIPVQARFRESRTVYPTPGEEVQVTVT